MELPSWIYQMQFALAFRLRNLHTCHVVGEGAKSFENRETLKISLGRIYLKKKVTRIPPVDIKHQQLTLRCRVVHLTQRIPVRRVSYPFLSTSGLGKIYLVTTRWLHERNIVAKRRVIEL